MHTHAVIFDGAPQNYGFARMNVLDNEGQWCYNHYNTTQEDAKIFFIVDPAHMIKNFRNQLHASLNGLAKMFVTRVDVDVVLNIIVQYFPNCKEIRDWLQKFQ